MSSENDTPKRRPTFAPLFKDKNNKLFRLGTLLAFILLGAGWVCAAIGRDVEGTVLMWAAIVVQIPGIIVMHRRLRRIKREVRAMEIRIIVQDTILQITDPKAHQELRSKPEIKAVFRHMGLSE